MARPRLSLPPLPCFSALPPSFPPNSDSRPSGRTKTRRRESCFDSATYTYTYHIHVGQLITYLRPFSLPVRILQLGWLRLLLSSTYHEYEVRPLLLVVGLLQDGLQEERVLGQPLHRPDQDVEQAEAVAVALRLAPLPNSNRAI